MLSNTWRGAGCPGSLFPTLWGGCPPTWHSHAGDGLRLAERVHLDVLEAFAGGTLQVPAPGWERVSDTQPPQKHHPSPHCTRALAGLGASNPAHFPCAEHPALEQDTDPSHHHIQRNSHVGETHPNPAVLFAGTALGQTDSNQTGDRAWGSAVLTTLHTQPSQNGFFHLLPYLFQSSSVSQNS